jgi:hypothetical protein
MLKKIYMDGVGNAGIAVLRALAMQLWLASSCPTIELRDRAVWAERHVEAGLVEPADLGQPKADAAAHRFRQAGWPADKLVVRQVDIRDLPRGAYCRGLTLALTDSHATKHLSVVRAQQVGSAAIAVGLGPGEATVELFSSGAGYCCVHGSDAAWQHRQPCMGPSSTSTTEIAWRRSRDTVRVAGELVARLIAFYATNNRLPHKGGFHIHGTTAESYAFPTERGCLGPHDRACVGSGDHVVRTPVPAEQLSLGAMLEHVGSGGCYADRPVAWRWHCQTCGQIVRRVHVVHPALECAVCGQRRQPALEQASGLTAAELTDLNEGETPTLAAMGLGGETIVRCTAPNGAVVWVEVEGTCKVEEKCNVTS